MNKFASPLALFAMLVVTLTPAFAGPIAVGTVASGYTFDGNFWVWSNGDTYTRDWTPGTAGYYYYSNGCQYYAPATSGYYTYTRYVSPVPAYTDPNWREKLVDIMAAQKKNEFKILYSAVEHEQYMQALDAAGLRGSLQSRLNGKYTLPQGAYGAAYSTPSAAATAGQTVYGYSVSTYLDAYGDQNLATLYQQAARLAQGSQQIAGDATKDFSALVGQQGNNMAKVAEILANGAAKAQIIKSLEGQGTTKIITQSTTTKTSPIIQADPMSIPKIVDQAKTGDALVAYINENCASCHSGPKAKGGLDLFKFAPEDKDEIVSKVLHRLSLPSSDPKSMPRDQTDTNKPGPRATNAQKKLFLE